MEDTTNSSFCNSTEDSSCTENDPFDAFKWHVRFLWVLLAVIVIGNSAVLAALVHTKKQRKTRMNFFIMHLALADLLVGLINVLTDLVWKSTVVWHAGNAACKIIKYFQTVVLYSSNYVLVALSIDRYDAIRHPLKFSRRFKILQCWVDMADKPNESVSWEWKLYLTIVTLAVFMIPAVIIAVCYTIMVHTIWTPVRILTPQTKNAPATRFSLDAIQRRIMCRNKSNGEQQPRPAPSRGLIPKAKIKSVEMTFVIVFVFILCSSPYYVFSLLQVYDCIGKSDKVNSTNNALSTFFASLSPLNSAANPIIYCLFSTNICQNLRKVKFVNWILSRLCPRWGQQNPISRHKFGHMNHQDVSQKTRTECTSLSDTFSRSANSIQSTRHSSTSAKRHIDLVHVVSNKDDIFRGEERSGENCVNNRNT